MNTNDTINYKLTGFDNEKYIFLQREHIVKRIEKFKGGRLYLEVGGKFLHDPHAARVLPGFRPDTKQTIFQALTPLAQLIFCVDAISIENNRQLKNTGESYINVCFSMIQNLKNTLGIEPIIVINLCERKYQKGVEDFTYSLNSAGFTVYKRYIIPGYPHDLNQIISPTGYGADDYIPVNKRLIIVTGAASNSGKMSTCLGQMYQDYERGFKSGYAKYETFPIWNLPLTHPVNLAYEAATADIGDYNVIDIYHQKAYGIESVNYNRDVDAFDILLKIGTSIVDENNFIRTYKSPTDMGINQAGFAITDDEIVSLASYDEIKRRRNWYQEIVNRGQGKNTWIAICNKLEELALLYIKQKGYNINKQLV